MMTPEQTKKFKYWQTRTIIVSMIGYALYYFVRKNFNTAMPSIEATFGITKTQLGIFLTLNGVNRHLHLLPLSYQLPLWCEQECQLRGERFRLRR